jgi:hypothetical protein
MFRPHYFRRKNHPYSLADWASPLAVSIFCRIGQSLNSTGYTVDTRFFSHAVCRLVTASHLLSQFRYIHCSNNLLSYTAMHLLFWPTIFQPSFGRHACCKNCFFPFGFIILMTLEERHKTLMSSMLNVLSHYKRQILPPVFVLRYTSFSSMALLPVFR